MMHSNLRPYLCNIIGCNKKFRTNPNFKSHLVTHNNLRPYHCNIVGCDKKFKRKAHLKLHL